MQSTYRKKVDPLNNINRACERFQDQLGRGEIQSPRFKSFQKDKNKHHEAAADIEYEQNSFIELKQKLYFLLALPIQRSIANIPHSIHPKQQVGRALEWEINAIQRQDAAEQ